MLNIPEGVIEVNALRPQAGAALTGDYICLKNINMLFVVVTIYQDTTDTVAITIEQATDVSNSLSDSKAITNVVPIWANEDCAASDAFTRQTDAVNFTTSAADDKIKKIIFQIDPALLDANSDFDCITVKTGASDATNLTEAHYLCDMKFKQETPPTVITD
jgi:hypothetical protein